MSDGDAMRSARRDYLWQKKVSAAARKAGITIHPRVAVMRALQQVLALIDDEKRQATEPAAVGALSNIANAINAMMEEPSP